MLFLARQINAFVYANNVHGFTAPVFPGTDVKAYNPYPATPFYTYAWSDKAYLHRRPARPVTSGL